MFLLSIAPELTLLISNQLNTEDVKSLRLTCKQLAEILNDVILRDLTIHITKDNARDTLKKLATLAKGDHAASRATRALYIRSLSPTYDPKYRGPSYTYINQRWVVEKEPEVPPEIILAEEEVRANLFKAIASLKAIQSVSWSPYSKDAEWAHIVVQNALTEMPELRHLDVIAADLKIPLPVTLTGLREISVTGGREKDQENIAKVIAASPQLTSVRVSFACSYDRPLGQHQSLHQLFKYWPANRSPLQLRELSLSNCLVRLDSTTLPHLTHLTSLELLGVEDPFLSHPFFPAEEESEVTTEKKIYGSSKDDVWKALTQVGVRLEEIVIEDATPSFVRYLSTYSGLKKLSVCPRNFFDGATSDQVARRFFGEALQNHCRTLQDLQIDAVYEGLWCFSEHNLPVLSRCEGLHTLSMAVISSEIRNDALDCQVSEDSDIIKRFLDTVITHMPRMRDLCIKGASSEDLRFALCGHATISHFDEVGKRLAARVNDYVPPLSCHRLPSLSIGSTRAVLVHDSLPHNGQGAKSLKYSFTLPEGWF